MAQESLITTRDWGKVSGFFSFLFHINATWNSGTVEPTLSDDHTQNTTGGRHCLDRSSGHCPFWPIRHFTTTNHSQKDDVPTTKPTLQTLRNKRLVFPVHRSCFITPRHTPCDALSPRWDVGMVSPAITTTFPYQCSTFPPMNVTNRVLNSHIFIP